MRVRKALTTNPLHPVRAAAIHLYYVPNSTRARGERLRDQNLKLESFTGIRSVKLVRPKLGHDPLSPTIIADACLRKETIALALQMPSTLLSTYQKQTHTPLPPKSRWLPDMDLDLLPDCLRSTLIPSVKSWRTATLILGMIQSGQRRNYRLFPLNPTCSCREGMQAVCSNPW